ncbi:MAG: glycoside hydrolase, partial [Clostridia bacterium]
MSKQVIIVSKTHLDLGFTDYVSNILEKYIDKFIPNAIKIAKEVNTDKKKFVWTTGSWLINKALTIGTEKQKEDVANALKTGDIVAHAFPFTTHTELMDGFLFEYGLSLVDKIDAIRGKKTISAKFSDVPGHTIAMLPYLAKKGIKLVHIGVNPASAVPKTPECFLWKYNDSEVIVIYSSKGYGGEFRTPFIDDILYFDHTHDNYGAKGKANLENSFKRFTKKYVGYEVVAGSLDDYAEKLWKVKDKLPIVTAEIGDTWIHGVASAPRKVA